jgi:hypothetical protein
MPYFLVTLTSLVEAQDEQQAAQTAIDRLRSGEQVTVSVKSNETTVTHVTVAALVEEPPVSESESDNSPPAVTYAPEAAFVAPEGRKLILKRMLADGLALLGRRR